MKKPILLKSTSEIYKDAGYSKEIVYHLEQWEFEYPSVENVLSEYRYIQSSGELFSEQSLKIIFALHSLESMLERQRQLTCDMDKTLSLLLKRTFRERKESSEPYFNEDVF